MLSDTWLDEMRVVSAKYRAELHTFELTVQPEGSSTTHVVLLDTRFFPNHPALQFLDEEVQIGENVKVILKSEKELELIGWKLAERKKKLLAHPDSKFLIGSSKKKMLGGVYNAKVGVTDHMQPYLVIEKFRFGPSEVKCIVRTSDLKVPDNAKTVTSPTNYGTFSYNAEKRQLVLPSTVYHDVAAISALIAFLKKAKLV